jgi:hypothetical protein
LATLEAFQKSKSQGPDGLSVEFFLGLYDLIKEDLLKVVQESEKCSKIHGSLNKTFLVFIPPKKETSSFEDFRPISYSNIIYKIISKIIENQLKPILSDIISEEQFGFLLKDIDPQLCLFGPRIFSHHRDQKNIFLCMKIRNFKGL